MLRAYMEDIVTRHRGRPVYREVPPFNDAPYADHWFETRLAE